jgi:hypothetical protein
VGSRAGLDLCEQSLPTGIQSPDRPSRTESLHRLSYTGPCELPVKITSLCNYEQEALHKSPVEIRHVVIKVCVVSIPGPWRLRLLPSGGYTPSASL